MIKNRTNCVLCFAPLRPVAMVEKLPVFMGCVDEINDTVNDIKIDMKIGICNNCGSFQVTELPDMNNVYKASHFSGSVGKLWSEHHEEFARFVNIYGGSNILEIGGGHGNLSVIARTLNPHKTWTIIDKNCENADVLKIKKVKVIREWFDTGFLPNEEYDTIVMSHVFEHLIDPTAIVEHLSMIQSCNERLIISLPRLDKFLEEKNATCINFEHTFYVTGQMLIDLLSRYDYQCNTVHNFKEHSIFMQFERKKETTTIKSKANVYENQILLYEYLQHFKEVSLRVNEYFSKTDKSHNFVFGAHVFSQYLFSTGLIEKNIVNILDNSAEKQNKRLYGSSLIVKSSEAIRNIKKANVAVYAGVYSNEIKEQLVKINPGVVFV